MKKQMKSIIFALILLLAGLHPYTNVQAQTTSYSYIEQLSDGYYATVYVEIQNPNARSSTKTASKTYEISSTSSSEIFASYKLTASFSYPYNNTAKCISATYSTSVNDSSWSFSNCSATYSGNKAIGSFTAKRKILGITTNTIEKTLTITCDKNGTIS